MSDKKPPMTVWIGPNQASPTMDNSGEQFGHYRTVRRGPLIQSGPYVHLGQFMEEVENRVCRRKSPPSLSTHEAIAIALYELVNEIEEGKS